MHIRTNPILNKILRPVLRFCEWLGENHPETLIRLRYFARFKRILNLKEPKTLNEKILYLALRTDTSMWSLCADKYAVRQYVADRVGEGVLIPLVGMWTNVEDIDWQKLPQKFVLKLTNGSGDTLIVTDKTKVDWNQHKSVFAREMQHRYGAVEGGIHYMRIKPRLIAEELIENDSETLCYSNSLVDYKIWCFNGKAQYIWACANRTLETTEVMTYDEDWNAHPEYSVFNAHYSRGKLLPKPKNFEKMLQIAEKLAKDFPCVRVDLYNVNGKIYFGELTFTSLGGIMDFYTDEFQLLAGSMITLPSATK